jgi:hypothetical protein
MAGERAQSRELAHERSAADALLPARGEEGTNVQRLQAEQRCEPRSLTEMERQEGQELPEVAAIRLDRLERQPAFAREAVEPRRHLAPDLRRAGREQMIDLGAGHPPP